MNYGNVIYNKTVFELFEHVRGTFFVKMYLCICWCDAQKPCFVRPRDASATSCK